jgi:uncharacterized protein (TIGR02996 family)
MTALALPTEQAALLRAIVAEPDEDTPRLVYADWLEESGDTEQAQFIRGSVELARLDPGSPEAVELNGRLRIVSYRYGWRWLEALGIARAVWAPALEFRYRRGFAEHLSCSHTGTLWKSIPVVFPFVPVRRLYVGSYYDNSRTDAGDLQRLAALPELARVRDLELGWFKTPDAAPWSALFGSPYLRELRTLRWLTCVLTRDDFRALVRAGSNLRDLTTLCLTESVGVGAVQELLAAPQFAGLTRLFFQGGYNSRGRETLVGGRFPPGLRVLSLGHLTPDLAEALVRAPHLSRLTELWVAWRDDPQNARPRWFRDFLDRYEKVWRNHNGDDFD